MPIYLVLDNIFIQMNASTCHSNSDMISVYGSIVFGADRRLQHPSVKNVCGFLYLHEAEVEPMVS